MEKSIKSSISRIIPLSIIALLLVGCDTNDEPSSNSNRDCISRSIEITAQESAASKQSNVFAWNLLEQCINQDDKGENLVISPLSANICLSMLANGACGDTRQQILNTMGFKEEDMDYVNSLNRKLATEICDIDNNVTLAIANSFWYNEAIKLKKVFLNNLKNNYTIQSFSINPPSFVTDVNRWCYENTNGLIPDIIGGNVRADFAFLNAIYFKGFWNKAYRFNKEGTYKDDFLNSDGTRSKVYYMCKGSDYQYHCDQLWRAIRIPFSGGGFNFTVILPNEDSTVEECMSSIKDFEPATAEFSSKELKVHLPKLRIRHKQDLCEIFRQLGMSDMFDECLADFSNMTDNDMVVNCAKQNVSFDLDEDGAEAAAVTITGLITTAGPIDSTLFYIDHPFIFLISEKSTGAILFMGRINKL